MSLQAKSVSLQGEIGVASRRNRCRFMVFGVPPSHRRGDLQPGPRRPTARLTRSDSGSSGSRPSPVSHGPTDRVEPDRGPRGSPIPRGSRKSSSACNLSSRSAASRGAGRSPRGCSTRSASPARSAARGRTHGRLPVVLPLDHPDDGAGAIRLIESVGETGRRRGLHGCSSTTRAASGTSSTTAIRSSGWPASRTSPPGPRGRPSWSYPASSPMASSRCWSTAGRSRTSTSWSSPPTPTPGALAGRARRGAVVPGA